MAASKHTPNHARARKRKTQRKRHYRRLQKTAPGRRRVAPAKAARSKAPDIEALREALEDHIRGLNVAMSAVIVSVAALRRQNCDIDEDIARVLERSAADGLDIEVERMQALIGSGRV